MNDVLRDVTGDLFVGEAKLFFSHPRHTWKLPFRLETAFVGGQRPPRPLSLSLHVAGPDMILLHDSRLNSVRLERTLRGTDIAADHRVLAYEPDNAGRWTNLRETSDGRHWSEGEHHWKRATNPSAPYRCERAERAERSAVASLISQLPPFAAEAVRDGRAVVMSRTATLWADSKSFESRNGTACDLSVSRVCKAFGNHVYALCRTEAAGAGSSRYVAALLFVGKFWPAGVVDCGTTTTTDVGPAPLLTVARKHEAYGTAGGRVICVCLGNRMQASLHGMSVEEISKCRRHYEGYVSEAEYESLSVKK